MTRINTIPIRRRAVSRPDWCVGDLAWMTGLALAIVQRECPVVAVISSDRTQTPRRLEYAEETTRQESRVA